MDSLPAGVPSGTIVFGPNANCTLDTCPLSVSVYKYRPSLAANATFLAAFAVAQCIHIVLGVRWRTVWFMSFMMTGCGSEIIGYVGRILMYKNPFSYVGFILQVIFLTGGPVFFSAAIYITLSVTIDQFAPKLSRGRSVYFYWSFIGADILCCALQASGGALSAKTAGASKTGVGIALAGLSLQVVVMVTFCLFLADYLFRYMRSDVYRQNPATTRIKSFFAFLSLATLMILCRCCYRCYELSQGYRGSDIIAHEGMFIGLEGVLVVVAVYALIFAHPGPVFGRLHNKE